MHFFLKRGILCVIALAFLSPSVSLAVTLEELISSALKSHPAIQAQQAQTQEAQANIDSANWQFYPTPSIAIDNAQTSSADRAYPGSATVSTLSMQQPLWTGGRLTAGLKKAETNLTLRQAASEEIRQQLAFRIIQIYGDWLAAYLKIQAYEQSMNTHVRLRELVERRVQQGASADSDVTLAVVRIESLAADLAFMRSQKDTALARLGQILGYRIDDVALSTVVAAPRPIGFNAQTALDMALAIHPTIQKAQAQAKFQETVIDERRAEFAPDVYLRAEQQYGNHSYANAGVEKRWFIGMNTRFGAGLSSLSSVAAAKAQYQASLADVAVETRAISEQVLADHALATSSESRLKAVRSSLEAVNQVFASYDRQFLAGRKTWLDLMNAARELSQTEIQLADMQAAYVVVSWRLGITTSGLLSVIESRTADKK